MGSRFPGGELMSAHEKGLDAATKVIMQDPDAVFADCRELARKVINAYHTASNPVGESETIYDDYYRLKTIACGLLATYDNTDDRYLAEALRGPFEGLRAILLEHSSDSPITIRLPRRYNKESST